MPASAIGAAFAGPAADRRVHDLELCHAGDRPDHQLRRQAALHVGRAGARRRSSSAAPTASPSRVGAQHSQDYSAWYSHVPGLYVIAPYSARRRQGPAQGGDPLATTRWSSSRTKSSTARPARCPRSTTTCCRSARRASRAPGKDVTIVSFSMGMRYATQATEKLVAAGVDVELIDLRTLRPMDSDTVVESVKKTGRLVTVEEGWPQGGIGAELAARVGAAGVRLPRCADHPRHRQGRADALCREPRKAGAAECRRSRRGGERRDVQELSDGVRQAQHEVRPMPPMTRRSWEPRSCDPRSGFGDP